VLLSREEKIFVVRLAFFIRHLCNELLRIVKFYRQAALRSWRSGIPPESSEMHQGTFDHLRAYSSAGRISFGAGNYQVRRQSSTIDQFCQ
jgi:hypothetical protein